jgi:hypothetical protein
MAEPIGNMAASPSSIFVFFSSRKSRLRTNEINVSRQKSRVGKNDLSSKDKFM